MASAIALTQAGVDCEIVELSEDWRPGGIGIALQSAPLRAAKRLGIFEALLGVGRRHDVIDMCGADGTRFAELPQVNVNDPGDPPFLGMARQALHEVMAAEVARLGTPVRLGVTAFRVSARGLFLRILIRQSLPKRSPFPMRKRSNGAASSTATKGSWRVFRAGRIFVPPLRSRRGPI